MAPDATSNHDLIVALCYADAISGMSTNTAVQIGSEKLARYFEASVELMQVLARACGHENLSDFNYNDITTWKREMAELSGIKFAGVMR